MMETMKKRHRSRRGETLVEILVAILIVALSATLFATMYSASMNIDLAAQRQDKLFYEAMEELEEKMDAGGGTQATVHYQPTTGTGGGSDCDVDVEFFTQDGMSAYGEKSGTGGTSSGGGTPSGDGNTSSGGVGA